MGRAADTVYDTLLSELLSGAYSAGERIREEDVAARVGTSRTPVREALRRLHAEGLIELPANRGAIVAESSIRDVDEIFDLRVLLEGYGARQAAGRRAEADLGELGELCDRMDAIVAAGEDFGDLTDLNLRFHRAVHEASGVERLVAMVAGLMVTPLVRETFRHYRADELTRSMAQHRELVEALTARDAAWAESVMSAHLHAAKASLRLQLQVPQPAVSDPG